MPLRGTYYKNDKTRAGTWIDGSFNHPYFNEQQTVFSIDTTNKVRKEDGLKISRETI